MKHFINMMMWLKSIVGNVGWDSPLMGSEGPRSTPPLAGAAVDHRLIVPPTDDLRAARPMMSLARCGEGTIHQRDDDRDHGRNQPVREPAAREFNTVKPVTTQ